MPLTIVKQSESILIKNINLCLYAPPGVGKTTLGFTADAPLSFDFDRGAHRARNRKDIVPVGRWGDVADFSAADLAPYNTIIVDTAGRCLDFMTQDIIAEDPKCGRGGALTLQGYGKLKSRFAAWLKMLNTFGKDVVLIAHMDEQRSGDDVVERLDVQGGSKAEIYKSVDAMGRIFLRDKQRVIDFSPRENAFGKNPSDLPVMQIPDVAVNPHFLAEVIAEIKAGINRESEEQKAAHEATEKWAEAVEGYKAADDFNRTLAEIKLAPRAAQFAFAQRAKALGLTFNAETKLYGGIACPVKSTETQSPAAAAEPAHAPADGATKTEPASSVTSAPAQEQPVTQSTAPSAQQTPAAAETTAQSTGALPSPTEQPPAKRKRRTKAEMAAAAHGQPEAQETAPEPPQQAAKAPANGAADVEPMFPVITPVDKALMPLADGNLRRLVGHCTDVTSWADAEETERPRTAKGSQYVRLMFYGLERPVYCYHKSLFSYLDLAKEKICDLIIAVRESGGNEWMNVEDIHKLGAVPFRSGVPAELADMMDRKEPGWNKQATA